MIEVQSENFTVKTERISQLDPGLGVENSYLLCTTSETISEAYNRRVGQ